MGCSGRWRCWRSCQLIMDELDKLFISHWYRDTGTYSLEETIHMLTANKTVYFALLIEGSLVVGNKADINVLDINQVERQPRRVEDFPEHRD